MNAVWKRQFYAIRGLAYVRSDWKLKNSENLKDWNFWCPVQSDVKKENFNVESQATNVIIHFILAIHIRDKRDDL